MFQLADRSIKGFKGITDRKKESSRAVWKINRLMVKKTWRVIDQDRKWIKWLMQSIPKRFLAFIYAEGRQSPKWIIQIINKFLAILCIVLFNRHQLHSFTSLRVHPLYLSWCTLISNMSQFVNPSQLSCNNIYPQIFYRTNVMI